MAQTVKFVDISKSYVPVDPNSYPQNLMDGSQEEKEGRPKAVVPYDGYNFLPTAYGYKSFFGEQYQLDVDNLPSPPDECFIFQDATLRNVLVAMCADGIYIKYASESGEWLHAVSYAVPEPIEAQPYEPWSWCILYNDLYMYKAGKPSAWRLPYNPASASADPAPLSYTPTFTVSTTVTSTEQAYLALAYKKADGSYSGATAWTRPSTTHAYRMDWTDIPGAVSYRVYKKLPDESLYYYDVPPGVMFAWSNSPPIGDWEVLASWPDTSWQVPGAIYLNVVELVPSFLNMTAQRGIFAAGMRLGFWDTEESVSWSALDNPADFTPSLQTLAGSNQFADQLGKIVTIRAFSDGFIIYATRSILAVAKSVNSAYLWTPVRILERGIMYPRQTVSTNTADLHFAYTSSGIFKIEKGQADLIIPEVWDLMQSHEAPVYLSLLNNRYLMLQIMEAGFDIRNTQFRINSVPPSYRQIYAGSTSPSVIDYSSSTVASYSYACGVMNEAQEQLNARAHSDPNMPEEEDPTSLWDAFYRTHYSLGGMPDSIDWQATGACPVYDANGVRLAWNPVNALIGSNTHHWISEDDPEGPSIYWQTLEKFMATQLAIWEKQEEARKAFIAEITSKTYTGKIPVTRDIITAPSYPNYLGVTLGDPWNRPVPVGDPFESECLLGYVPIAYSAPMWEVSNCGMSLRRYCIARAPLYITSQQLPGVKEIIKYEGAGWVLHDANGVNGGGWLQPANPMVPMPYPDKVAAGYAAVATMTTYFDPTNLRPRSEMTGAASYRHYAWTASWYWGGSEWSMFTSTLFTPGEVLVHYPLKHRMVLGQVEYGVWGVDTGYMEVAGWKERFGTGRMISATGGCLPPEPLEDPDSPSIPMTFNPPIDPATGETCGSQFPSDFIVPPIDPVNPISWPAQGITLPGYRILLQDGSNAPAYPIFYGAFAYDTFLNKWGRHKGMYRLYLDYSPVNGKQGEPIEYTSLLSQAGVVDIFGRLAIFDENASDSRITLGKIGYYRKGYTDAEEVKVQFAAPFTGYIQLEPSYEGKSAELAASVSANYENVMQASLFANLSARWYNITVSGKYDISYIEFRGHSTGRR